MNVKSELAQSMAGTIESLPCIALRLGGEQSNGGGAVYITESVQALGYEREDFLSGRRNWLDFVHPEDVFDLCETIQAYMENSQDDYLLQYRVQDTQGNSVWVTDSRHAVRSEEGDIRYTDGIITAKHWDVQANSPLEECQAQQQAMNDMLLSVHYVKGDEALQTVLERTGWYLGSSRGLLLRELPQKGLCEVTCLWENDDSLAPVKLGQQIDCGRLMPGVMADMRAGKSHLKALEDVRDEWFQQNGMVAAAAVPVQCGGRPYGFFLFESRHMLRHITPGLLTFTQMAANLMGAVLRYRQGEESLRRVSQRDQLTGLYTRQQFDGYLNNAITKAQAAGKDGYVLFVDLDDFKIINEGYGHLRGDALLVEVARYLRKTYEDKCSIFRFGGDEFVLLIGHEYADAASSIMDDILGRARHPWHVQGGEFYCTLSLGAVRFPDYGMSRQDVVKNAEIAIHSAKSLGKNNCVVFNQGMDNNSLRRVELEHRMREAIDNSFEGFTVYYQPMVDMSGNIIGAEALLRWFDKEGNLTGPGEFIPLAEYLGLIVPLGAFVLRQAATECRRINETMPAFKISVNVSVRQFQHQNILGMMEEILQQTGVDPTNIVLEVTEGVLVDDFDQMHSLLEQLRMMGFQVAMDDFGTGYSSLSSMRRLPLDIIKIDRSFVVDSTHDAYAQSFIRLITNLTHSMGRKVCVEGVELATQYSYCAECRVDSIQGFYFYKPMPREQLHTEIARNRVRVKR